jgi:putative transcriptional regulator
LQDNSAIVEHVLSIIKRSNARAELILYPREGRSVDIVTRANERPVLMKITYTTTSLTENEVSDLRKARSAYSASTIVVAVKNKRGDLESEVVYFKHGSYVITLETLENMLSKNEYPLVAYIRGNYVLKINSEKFKKRAKELGLTRGDIAEYLGVTKKAVYMYERGEMYIDLERGLKLASIMGEDIFEEFNPLKDVGELDQTTKEPSQPRDALEEALYELASATGSTFYIFSRMPVDVAIRGRRTFSIVKDTTDKYREDKIESAERLSENTNAELYVVRSVKDVKRLSKVLTSNNPSLI